MSVIDCIIEWDTKCCLIEIKLFIIPGTESIAVLGKMILLYIF